MTNIEFVFAVASIGTIIIILCYSLREYAPCEWWYNPGDGHYRTDCGADIHTILEGEVTKFIKRNRRCPFCKKRLMFNPIRSK